MGKTKENDLLSRYQMLIDLACDLASTLESSALLKRIVIAASELIEAQAASILLYDEVAQELHFETTTNADDPKMEGLVVPVENSIAGWIVIHRQPLIISDVHKDPRHYRVVGDMTDIITDSLLGVPLIAKDKVVGVLEAINKRSGDFTSEDQDLLMALGSQAAVAIENARLFQQSDQISELVHEIRTPLTSINMSAKLLLDPKFPDASRQELIEMILGETRRLTEMTTDFLNLSRLETGRAQYKYHDINLKSLLMACTQMVSPQAEESEVQITLNLPEELPEMRGDYDKIKQVVINLLNNAIKYNQPGGEVHLCASTSDDLTIIKIQDTGMGIPEESLPNLFEKFFRVPGVSGQIHGTGLGLTISKRIIEDHNGEIKVSSKENAGTSIEIHLPNQNDQEQ